MSSDLNWRPHELIVRDDDRLQCLTCQRTWKNGPEIYCPGIRVYPGLWSDVWPEGLMTKTQLGQAGYTTGKKLPAPAALLHWSNAPQGDGYLRLYDPGEATPKRVMSEGQKEALQKAQQVSHRNWHCDRCERKLRWYGSTYCNHCEIVIEAIQIIEDGDAVILDSETTGLAYDDEIIELAVIDLEGNVLLNQRIKPHRPENIHRCESGYISAYDIHGISADDLLHEPTFKEVYPTLLNVLGNRKVLIYNADFDLGKLEAMSRQDGLKPVPLAGQTCVMEMYAQWYGDWSYNHRSYRWQRLPGGDHSAVGDCQATLQLLRKMAADDGSLYM